VGQVGFCFFLTVEDMWIAAALSYNKERFCQSTGFLRILVMYTRFGRYVSFRMLTYGSFLALVSLRMYV
jgi:hypothetical protein